jgi:Cu(I)/Ag(I) efflux system membrane fusion protein
MKILKSLLLLIIGAGIGIGSIHYFFPNSLSTSSISMGKMDEKAPLYWVAPMNPDFKRDKPGKSPMGMDLIPVYSDNSAETDEGQGAIRISPDVVNNLGVRVTQVIRQPLQTKIKTVGYVQYDEDKLIHVHPRVEGWVEKLYVKATGDPVKQGQALYTLYSPNLVNAQEELLIALQRKNERLIRAAQTRLKALDVSAWFITNLKKTRKVKQAVTFYAPQSGVMSMLNIREGFFVKPETSMMTIGVIDEVWVQAEIFERQAEQIKIGLPVAMTIGYIPGREWLGQVDYIYPTLEASTRTLRVRLRFDNKDRVLMPNMFTQIVIHTNSVKPVLMLPREAVIRTGEMDRVVLALGEGKFKSVAVKIGRSDEKNIEILEGVKEGEDIVASAQFLIDSESSKTSDFKRINHQDNLTQHVTVNATINFLRPEHRMVNVTHQAISEWNRPEMTMNFLVNESVDLSSIHQDMVVALTISHTEQDGVEVTSIVPSDSDSPKETEHKMEMQQ